MLARVPFATVCEVLELEGWTLQRVYSPYRIFIRLGRLPIWVRVEDKEVDADDWERIKKIIQADEERDE